jgi:hypothetical protein
MTTMNHRTTFALDEATAKRLRGLAVLWKVSQAEVVRRALARAEAEATAARPDPVAMLSELHARGQGLNLEEAETYLREVGEARQHWRGR